MNSLGEIEYREILAIADINTLDIDDSIDNLVTSEPVVINPADTLGEFVLGQSKLGLNRFLVHKIVTAAKGKTLAIQIEFDSPEECAIESIGILYKLGKVKESR